MEVTLHPNSASAFKAEAEDVAEQRKVRAGLLRKEAEAEEKRQKKIREAPGCWLFRDRYWIHTDVDEMTVFYS